MNNQKAIIVREPFHVFHDSERPQKRHKSIASYMEAVIVLSDIGENNYNRGEYTTAKECFSQALCHIDVDYFFSQIEVNNTSFEMDPIKNTNTSKDLILVEDKSDECISTSVVQLDEGVICLRHSSEEHSPIQKKVEYDEGMRVYPNLLPIEKTNKIEEVVGTLCFNVAQTYVQRGLHSKAIPWFQKSLDKFLPEAHVNQSSLPIVMIFSCLGCCYYLMGNDDKAKIFYQRAHDTIIKLDFLFDNKIHLISSFNCLGVIFFNDRRACEPELAMKMFRKSLELYKKSCDDSGRRIDQDLVVVTNNRRALFATIMNNIGRIHYMRSDFKKALVVYKECLKLRQESLGCGSIDVAATAYNLGQTCYQLGHLDDALSYYHTFLNTLTFKVGRTFKDIALVYKGIAEIHQDKSNYTLALRYFIQALEIQKANSEEQKGCYYDAEVATTLNKLGNLCYEMKDFPTALKYYQEGLKIETNILEPSHPHTIVTMTNIGHIHKQLGQHKDALVAYQRVRQMQLKRFGVDHFVLAEIMSCIGLMQYHLRLYEDSFDSYQEALRIRRQQFGENNDEHPEIASTLNSIGLVLFKQQVYDLAKNCFMESLRIRIKILGKDHRDVALLWYNIATIHFEMGEEDEAIKMYKETLRVERCALGEDHPDVAVTLQHLGQVHQQLGYADKAMEYFLEALDIERRRRRKTPVEQRFVARVLNLLGNIYLQVGRTSEMMECFIEASRIYRATRGMPSSGGGVGGGNNLVIGGYNFYSISKTNPPCAAMA